MATASTGNNDVAVRAPSPSLNPRMHFSGTSYVGRLLTYLPYAGYRAVRAVIYDLPCYLLTGKAVFRPSGKAFLSLTGPTPPRAVEPGTSTSLAPVQQEQEKSDSHGRQVITEDVLPAVLKRSLSQQSARSASGGFDIDASKPEDLSFLPALPDESSDTDPGCDHFITNAANANATSNAKAALEHAVEQAGPRPDSQESGLESDTEQNHDQQPMERSPWAQVFQGASGDCSSEESDDEQRCADNSSMVSLQASMLNRYHYIDPEAALPPHARSSSLLSEPCSFTRRASSLDSLLQLSSTLCSSLSPCSSLNALPQNQLPLSLLPLSQLPPKESEPIRLPLTQLPVGVLPTEVLMGVETLMERQSSVLPTMYFSSNGESGSDSSSSNGAPRSWTTEALAAESQVSEQLGLILRRGFKAKGSKALQVVLGEYLQEVRDFSRNCPGGRPSATQQAVMRQGLIELMAQKRIVDTLQDIRLGVDTFKRASRSVQELREAKLVERINQLSQARAVLSDQSCGQGAVIKTLLGNAVLKVPPRQLSKDPVQLENLKEARDYLMRDCLNICEGSLQVFQEELTQQEQSLESKDRELADLEAQTGQAASERKKTLRDNVLWKCRAVEKINTKIEAIETARRIHGSYCDDDVLRDVYIKVAEMLRLELVNKYTRYLKSVSIKKSAKNRLGEPQCLFETMKDNLTAQAENIVRGHQSTEGKIFEAGEFAERAQVQLENLKRTISHTLMEVLFAQANSVEDFCGLPVVKALDNARKSQLLQHLMIHCPVEIPAVHKAVLFDHAVKVGLMGRSEYTEEQFIGALKLCCSPFQPELLASVAKESPETLTRLITSTHIGQLCSEEIHACYVGCRASMENEQIKKVYSHFNITNNEEDIPGMMPNLSFNSFTSESRRQALMAPFLTAEEACAVDSQSMPKGIKYQTGTWRKPIKYADANYQALMIGAFVFHVAQGMERSLTDDALDGVMKDQDAELMRTLINTKVRMRCALQQVMLSAISDFQGGYAYRQIILVKNMLPGQMCWLNTDILQPQGSWVYGRQKRSS